MITKRTVFVLGAGASMYYGFPSGAELVDKICKHELPLPPALLEMGFTEHGQFGEFRQALWKSGSLSVDAFLSHRREFVDIGKYAIAATLIGHEKPERLFERKNQNGDPNWYQHVLNRMDVSFDDLDKNRLSIVTFNYDRSFEHYLVTALANRYGKSEKDVAEKLASIPVVHVHGQLGFLPWQEAAGPMRPYGTSVGQREVRIGAQGIKIISEANEETPDFILARKLLVQAERIYFLGFGYHPENMRRLRVPFEDTSVNRHITGTCFGMADVEREGIESRYPGLRLNAPVTHMIHDFLRNDPGFVRDG